VCDDRPRIADNPSFAKFREELAGAKTLMKLRPLLGTVGVSISDEVAAKIYELDEARENLSTLPDRFNDLLADRGC